MRVVVSPTLGAPVANARMYSVNAACAADWKRLLAWVLARAGLRWRQLDHDAPAPLSALWSRADLGAVLMCGLPYAARPVRPMLIAAPVPSPRRYAGRPVYCTDIAVAAASPHRTLEDTFGGIVGYTLADSFSGGVALRRHLAGHRTAARPVLYREARSGWVHARGVIEALADGRIDVGPLDSYYHDLLRRHEPALAATVRVVASTAMQPIPAFVATASLSDDELGRLREAFLAVADAAELADMRRNLLLDGFAVPEPARYEALPTLAGEAGAET